MPRRGHVVAVLVVGLLRGVHGSLEPTAVVLHPRRDLSITDQPVVCARTATVAHVHLLRFVVVLHRGVHV